MHFGSPTNYEHDLNKQLWQQQKINRSIFANMNDVCFFSFSLDIFIIPQKCTSMSFNDNQLIMLDWIIKRYGNDVDEQGTRRRRKRKITQMLIHDERCGGQKSEEQ